jgi:hypothetical protein
MTQEAYSNDGAYCVTRCSLLTSGASQKFVYLPRYPSQGKVYISVSRKQYPLPPLQHTPIKPLDIGLELPHLYQTTF